MKPLKIGIYKKCRAIRVWGPQARLFIVLEDNLMHLLFAQQHNLALELRYVIGKLIF